MKPTGQLFMFHSSVLTADLTQHVALPIKKGHWTLQIFYRGIRLHVPTSGSEGGCIALVVTTAR